MHPNLLRPDSESVPQVLTISLLPSLLSYFSCFFYIYGFLFQASLKLFLLLHFIHPILSFSLFS